MRDKIKVLAKCMFGEKNSFSALRKLIVTAIGYISAVFSFGVLLKDLMAFDGLETFCKSYWWILVLGGIIASLIHNRGKASCEGTLNGDDFQIAVKVDDLFAVKASSYVIPTNTFFRTEMMGEYISPQSVQGTFQLKYFKDNTSELDRLISISLKQQGVNGEDSSDMFGSVKSYPVGTVAKVDHDGKHFYFVAVNDVNKYGRPENQGYANIEIALTGLIDTINKLGHCDDLAMPLIGTGRAAIRGASIEKVIENTVDKVLSAKEKICRKLIICIKPTDYLEGRANLTKIQRFIDYKCEFIK